MYGWFEFLKLTWSPENVGIVQGGPCRILRNKDFILPGEDAWYS